MRLALVLAVLAAPALANGFRALEGHGGPVMGLAATEDGDRVLSASFDYAVGVWDGDAPPRWLDGHRAAVNAVAILPGRRAVSAGDDFAVRIWDLETGAALHEMTGHTGKVMAVRASPDGRLVASASWDATVRLWNTETGAEIAVLDGHAGNVNDVVFSADGTRLYSAAHDGTIREWDIATGETLRTLARHGFGINRVVVNEALDWLAYGALDGGTRAIRLSDASEIADLTLERRPILALALRPDGAQLSVGDGEGYIMVVDTTDWSIHRDFHAAKNGPVWALAYVDNGASIAAGGIDNAIYVFPLSDPDLDLPQMAEVKREFHTDPDAVSNGERQFLRKCSVCHTLTPDTARRAGPSLHGVFGRAAGTLPGYPYSEALRSADIVWSEETIDRLFEIGPDHLTPGSKMPMQQIAEPEDRADLIAFLKARTTPDPERTGQ